VALQIARDLPDDIRAEVERTMKSAGKDTKNLGLHYRLNWARPVSAEEQAELEAG
jgi:hypothetical protein